MPGGKQGNSESSKHGQDTTAAGVEPSKGEKSNPTAEKVLKKPERVEKSVKTAETGETVSPGKTEAKNKPTYFAPLMDVKKDKVLVEVETTLDRAVAIITRDRLGPPDISQFRRLVKAFLTRTHVPARDRHTETPSSSKRAPKRERVSHSPHRHKHRRSEHKTRHRDGKKAKKSRR